MTAAPELGHVEAHVLGGELRGWDCLDSVLGPDTQLAGAATSSCGPADLGAFPGGTLLELVLADNRVAVVCYRPQDSVVVWASTSLAAVMGRDPADVLGRPFPILTGAGPLAWQGSEPPTPAAQAKQKYQHVRPDGTPCWIEATTQPVLSDDGSVQLLVAMFRDVGGEVAADKEVAERESHYRILAERTSDVVLQYDVREHLVWASPSLFHVLGYQPEDLRDSPTRPLHPDDREPVVAAVVEAVAAGLDQVMRRSRVTSADGHTLWMDVTMTLLRDDDGEFCAIICTLHDVTELVAARAEAERSEQLLRDVSDGMLDPQILIELGSDGAGGTPQLRCLSVNRATCEYFHVDREDLVGRDLADLLPSLGASGLLERYLPDLASGAPIILDGVPYIDEVLGVPRWFDVRATWVPAGLSVTWRDVTDRLAASERLSESESRFRLLAENASDLVALSDPVGILNWVSPSIARMGWTPAEVVGRRIEQFLHPMDRPQLPKVERAGTVAKSVTVEWRMRHKRDGYHWYRVAFRPITTEDDTVSMWVSGWADIHAEVEQRELDRYREAALARSENRFRSAMDNAPIGMALIDLERRFVQANPALVTMLGRDADWLNSHGIPDITDTVNDRIDQQMRAVVFAGHPGDPRREMQLLTSDNKPIWVQHSVGLVRDGTGAPISYVSQFVDIGEVRQAREQIEFLADHDPLTALPNRRWLTERLATILSHPPRGQSEVGVLFCDLDGLKEVNDTLGHAAGDQLIVEVTRRLKAAIREGDFTARVGGDELVVLLPWLNRTTDLATTAEKIRAAVDKDLQLATGQAHPTLSIGATLARSGEDPQEALERADRALYLAKREGRNQIRTNYN